MIAKGKFEVSPQFEPPYDDSDGVVLGRASFQKRFEGALSASSSVQMLAARTPASGSGGYVALERIRGELDGRRGSFVVVHMGLMTAGAPSLTIRIVPDSGTEALAGIAGTMSIDIVEGQHFYTVDYTLPG